MKAVENNPTSRGRNVVLWPVSGVLMLALCVGSWVSIRDGARELATQREIIRLRDEWRAFGELSTVCLRPGP